MRKCVDATCVRSCDPPPQQSTERVHEFDGLVECGDDDGHHDRDDPDHDQQFHQRHPCTATKLPQTLKATSHVKRRSRRSHLSGKSQPMGRPKTKKLRRVPSAGTKSCAAGNDYFTSTRAPAATA